MKPLPMHQAKRCRATSKRSRKPCQTPAVRAWAVCRMHGAGGGAPEGNMNALKHGRYTAKALAERRFLRELLRETKYLLGVARSACRHPGKGDRNDCRLSADAELGLG
jgi:hypothetical protein